MKGRTKQRKMVARFKAPSMTLLGRAFHSVGTAATVAADSFRLFAVTVWPEEETYDGPQ